MENGERLDSRERAELLSLARATIAEHLCRGASPALPRGGAFESLSGAFVSLHGPGGGLRGCIGRMDAIAPLVEVVRDMALAAAFGDPRFRPLAADELEGLRIEITLLSPLRPGRVEEIEIGRHGVHITARGRSAVFLPQVAPEQGWGRDALLENLCHKAGLPPDAWRWPEAALSLFEGLVFGEA